MFSVTSVCLWYDNCWIPRPEKFIFWSVRTLSGDTGQVHTWRSLGQGQGHRCEMWLYHPRLKSQHVCKCSVCKSVSVIEHMVLSACGRSCLGTQWHMPRPAIMACSVHTRNIADPRLASSVCELWFSNPQTDCVIFQFTDRLLNDIACLYSTSCSWVTCFQLKGNLIPTCDQFLLC